MGLPLLPRIEGRGILRRLHRDDRGLASMEFVLAAPVIVFITLYVGHANRIAVEKMDTMRDMRSAAFAKANGLPCSPDFTSMAPGVVPDAGEVVDAGGDAGGKITKDTLECTQRATHEGEGEDGRSFIWEDMNAIAREKDATEDLAGKLAQEAIPQFVTANAERIYRYTKREQLRPYTWRDSFTVDDATLFVSDTDATRRGYDPTLREAMRQVTKDNFISTDGAGELFDGIFPGAE